MNRHMLDIHNQIIYCAFLKLKIQQSTFNSENEIGLLMSFLKFTVYEACTVILR